MPGLYLDRAAWGANPNLPRKGYEVSRDRFGRLIVHHTVIVLPDYDGDGFTRGDIEDICRYMQRLQTARPDLGLDVPYSFVVFAGAQPWDYVVCEGRGFERTGAHTAGYNSTAYGVALAGDFTYEEVTPGMIEGIKWVGRQLSAPVDAAETLGHRDTKPTACPGDQFYPFMGYVQPPFAAVAEPVPPPPPSVYIGVFPMDAVQVMQAHVQLDEQGNGWTYADFPISVSAVVGSTVVANHPMGPDHNNPADDGYGKTPKVAATLWNDQANPGRVLLTVTEGWPRGQYAVWISAA